MHELSNGQLDIKVSNTGAELQGLRFSGKEYLYQKEEGFWQRQSPILFPIVGRLKNDEYEYNSVKYKLSQHGFLRDMEWTRVASSRPNELLFRVNSVPETRVKYPWNFEVDVGYILEHTTLRVEYVVRNSGNEILPFSLGGHPAFHTEGPISDYSIEFEQDDGVVDYDTLDKEQKGLISHHGGVLALKSGILKLSEELFRIDALIFRNLKSQKLHLLRKGKIVFTFDRGNFPHFALWKQPNAPFLCFEPWQGFADSVLASGKIFEKPGIRELKSGETKTYHWSVKFPG